MVSVWAVRDAGSRQPASRFPQRAHPERDLRRGGHSHDRHVVGCVLRCRGHDRLASPPKPNRVDLLRRRPLPRPLDLRSRIRHLHAPHGARLAATGGGSVLARAVDLGAGARPDPGVLAPPVPRRTPTVSPLEVGVVAGRPLHRPDLRDGLGPPLVRKGSHVGAPRRSGGRRHLPPVVRGSRVRRVSDDVAGRAGRRDLLVRPLSPGEGGRTRRSNGSPVPPS